MPRLGSIRKKGTGSISERSAGHYGFRYYDKATKRQAVRTFVAPRAERGASIRAARAALPALVADVSPAGMSTPTMPIPSQRSTLTPPGRQDSWGCAGRVAHALRVSWPCPHPRNGYRIRAERFKAAIGSVTLSALGSATWTSSTLTGALRA